MTCSKSGRTKGTKAVALAGEGCGEAWLPYLDMMLSLQVSWERYDGSGQWDPVPLFNAVYHVYRQTGQGRERLTSFAGGTVALEEVIEGEGLRMFDIVGDANQE